MLELQGEACSGLPRDYYDVWLPLGVTLAVGVDSTFLAVLKLPKAGKDDGIWVLLADVRGLLAVTR